MRFCSLAGFSINEVHSGRWLQTSHYIAALELARKGLGVALVPDFLADQYVASGELRFFSDHKMATNEDYYLCVKISRCDEMATMALIQWFKKQVASKNSKQLNRRSAAVGAVIGSIRAARRTVAGSRGCYRSRTSSRKAPR